MTEYALLLLPSANRVYADAAVDLTVAELAAFNDAVLDGRLSAIEPTLIAGVAYVTFAAASLSDRDLAFLANVSARYALYERTGSADADRRISRRDLFHGNDDLHGILFGIARVRHEQPQSLRLASNPLAFFSYPWVRYQERRFLSMGERNIRHAKRRLRTAIAPQGIRRPAARPSHQA